MFAFFCKICLLQYVRIILIYLKNSVILLQRINLFGKDANFRFFCFIWKPTVFVVRVMKRIAALVIAVIMLLSFTSCGRSGGAIGSIKGYLFDLTDPTGFQLNEFDDELITYLSLNGYDSSDYIISPTAFRASLCLAAAGAQANTRTELVAAAGFSSMDSFNAWYDGLKKSQKIFAFKTSGKNAFSVANSVWSSKELVGEFDSAYVSSVKDKYNADAFSCDVDAFSQQMNKWINEKTDGIIPATAENMSGAASVLFSSLHLKDAWKTAFCEASAEKGVFTDSKGEEKPMDFMEQTNKYLYAQGNGTKVLVIPMKGNISFVCFLGDYKDAFEEMVNLKEEKVHVVLPKFEMESLFSAKDVLAFLLSRNVSDAISENNANFYSMCNNTSWFIQEIMQENKLTVNEGGISVKARAEKKSSEVKEGETVREFIADRPFSFAVFSDIGTKQQHMLLYGQMKSGK